MSTCQIRFTLFQLQTFLRSTAMTRQCLLYLHDSKEDLSALHTQHPFLRKWLHKNCHLICQSDLHKKPLQTRRETAPTRNHTHEAKRNLRMKRPAKECVNGNIASNCNMVAFHHSNEIGEKSWQSTVAGTVDIILADRRRQGRFTFFPFHCQFN